MEFRHRRRVMTVGIALLPALLIVVGPGVSASGPAIPVTNSPLPDEPGAVVAPSLATATGRQHVVVQLARPGLAASVPEGALTDGTLPSAAAQQQILAAVKTDQDAVANAASSLGATELGRVDTALDALVLDVDAARITELATIPGVVSIRPVGSYETQADPSASGSLEQAAAYLQVDAVRAGGTDGTGVRVAVLDSGIDYTHADLGGPGTTSAYAQCYGPNDVAVAPPCDAYFGPNAPKVKGGYDFVSESWPFASEVSDPNPIDAEGHGTHVSDIIGGNGPNHKGLAPGVSLYGVKVCSAVSSSCSGLALLEGVDWAMDPNGDGDVGDAVDLMNLSLGSDYGGDEDDLAFALDNAVRAGVVVVASAGNGGDRPFKVGQPSEAARVISVAQTALPDDKSYVISVTSPANVAGLTDNLIKLTVLQSWGGPVPASPGLLGSLVRPTGSALGCNPSDFGPATAGKVALVNRGTCAVSEKASNAQAAGATGFILVNNVGGAPSSFSFGGGATITIPVLAVSQPAGGALVSAVNAGPVSVQIDPARAVSLAGTMVASSSRGPSIDGIRVKPDIGAPGAWLSAEVGTGNGQTNFGGTSGAAPTVSGVAVLLLQQFPKERPALIKTRLLNSADTHNRTPDLDGNLYPTPISRIGAGEVRALPSSAATFRLRSEDKGAGNLALGSLHVSVDTVVEKQVTIQNLAKFPQTVTLALSFRDPADAVLGALSVLGTGPVPVPAKSATTVTLKFKVKAANLTTWTLTGTAGVNGGDGTVLNGPELDGNLTATSTAGEAQHLGWHALPHRSANASAPGSVRMRGTNQAAVPLTNASSVLDGRVSAFALTGTSPKLPKPAAGTAGAPGSEVALIDLLNVGVGTDATTVAFAVNGNGRRPSPLYPAQYEVDIDTNRDGTPDFAVFNAELGGFGVSGQSAVYVQRVGSYSAAAYFYSTADFDSANMVLRAPLSALGLAPNQSFNFSVTAYDNYFSGRATDTISAMTYTVGAPKFALSSGGSPITELVVPRNGTVSPVITSTGSVAPSTETGVLFMYDDAAGREADAVIAKP